MGFNSAFKGLRMNGYIPQLPIRIRTVDRDKFSFTAVFPQ